MKRLLFLLFLLAAPVVLRAQGYTAPDVVISNEKANIGGKVYYIHKVLPKQTVFSICKAYGIKSDDLMAANPDLKDGLKAGGIIFIPVDSAQIPAQTVAKPAVEKKPEPEVVETPEPVAMVPVVERVVEHRVKWFESLSGIAKKYGVSEDTIRDYNGLKPFEPIRGKILLIPTIGEEPAEATDPDLEEPRGRTETVTPEAVEPEPVTPVHKVRWFTADDPLRIALVLPFNVNGSSASSSFLNFYAGALMAVREQKDKGAHLVLNVFDLAKGASAILADPKFQESDLVIGPVEANTLSPFLAFSDENGIPLVSPLDHKVDSLVETHPFLFQVPASTTIQVENMVRSIRPRSEDQVILMTSTSASDSPIVEQIEALLQADGISYKKTNSREVSGLLSTGARRPAKIIIGSENKTFTTDVIRNLNTLSKRNVPFEVWCTNRVRGYETSDPDALFNISAHTSAPYFVDYSDPKDQSFVLQYRALYYAEPDDFAFQGYDVFSFFIASLMQYGTAFLASAEEHPMQLLHCNFHFIKEDAKSGWRNCATRNIVYEKEGLSIAIAR